MRKTLLLVGAGARLRNAVRRLLLSTPGLQSVAFETCPDPFEAVLDIGRKAPDIVVWIAAGDGPHGLEIASKIQKVHRKTRVVFLRADDGSALPAGEYVRQGDDILICSDVRGLGRSLLDLLKMERVEPSWEVRK